LLDAFDTLGDRPQLERVRELDRGPDDGGAVAAVVIVSTKERSIVISATGTCASKARGHGPGGHRQLSAGSSTPILFPQSTPKGVDQNGPV